MQPRDGAVSEVRKLGKYEVVGTLGKGAMGTVYDGRDPVIDRRVAIKTIPLPEPSDAEAQDELARFKREAQAAGRLHHPNLVGVHDYGETDTLAYIVMEFVDGTSLKALLDKQERFTPAETVRVMTGVLAGLQYSHERGVVHRDIKPANVMVTSAGVVKIADFGIARIESSVMTQAGTIMGTPAYMSPEQFISQTVDARTDIYSAGVLLYHMLTGERPFTGSMTAIMHKALNTTPPRPSDLSVTVSPALDAVVAKAMAKRPEDRYATAGAFATALQQALTAVADDDATMVVPSRDAPPPPALPAKSAAGRPVAGAPVAAAAALPGRRVLPGWLLGVVGLVVVAVGGGAYLLLPHGGEPAKPAAVSPPNPPPMPPPSPAPRPAPPVPIQAAPVPAPAPPPTTDALHRAITAAIAAVPCSLIDGAFGADGGAIMGGVMPASEDEALHHALRDLSPTAISDWRVDMFKGPYCPLLDVLRPVAAAFGQPDAGPRIILKNGAHRLRDNDLLLPRVVLPDFPSVLQLDYFVSDGSVTHLHQPSEDAGRLGTPGASVQFGEPRPGFAGWQIGQPFGTDLIVAIASDKPLFAGPRPDDDTTAAYLRDLRSAIEAAKARGGRVAARAFVVETVEK